MSEALHVLVWRKDDLKSADFLSVFILVVFKVICDDWYEAGFRIKFCCLLMHTSNHLILQYRYWEHLHFQITDIKRLTKAGERVLYLVFPKSRAKCNFFMDAWWNMKIVKTSSREHSFHKEFMKIQQSHSNHQPAKLCQGKTQ